MSRYALHRLIAWALVLVLGIGTTAPGWAVPVVPVPGHHFAIAAPPADAAECHDCDSSCEACAGANHDDRVTHADCVICLGLALPVGVVEPVRELPARFEIGPQTHGAGVQSVLDPHPPRSLSHRI
jgi:hypothetical protein